MIAQGSVLVQLVRLVDRLPAPPPPTRPGRGRPPVYPDGLFLKALVIMTVRRLHKVGELLAVLEEPTEEMLALRRALSGPDGRFPCRRTFERRLRALPETLPERIALLGRRLAELLRPWARSGRAAAVDSTVLRARGGVWHKKDREAGVVPHSSIDTEAGWTKSGWHGWAYGWKLHLAVSVGSVWIPLAARLTPANVHDGKAAPSLIGDLPEQARFVLGDKHYDAEELKAGCLRNGRFLVSPRRGAYPHADDGAGVRRVFHLLRHRAIENFNGHFKALFDAHGPVPTKGRADTARFALGAVLVYQMALLHRHEERLSDANRGLKAFLRAA
jgi:hypothetical protein